MVDNPDLGMYKMMNGYAPLMRWKWDASGLEPGTATRWEYSKDGATLTIHLRKGVRWSDGVEFTSEPTEHFYGIDCGFRDPFGNQLRFVQLATEPNGLPRTLEAPATARKGSR